MRYLIPFICTGLLYGCAEPRPVATSVHIGARVIHDLAYSIAVDHAEILGGGIAVDLVYDRPRHVLYISDESRPQTTRQVRTYGSYVIVCRPDNLL